jgi:hypothetical protein
MLVLVLLWAPGELGGRGLNEGSAWIPTWCLLHQCAEKNLQGHDPTRHFVSKQTFQHWTLHAQGCAPRSCGETRGYPGHPGWPWLECSCAGKTPPGSPKRGSQRERGGVLEGKVCPVQQASKGPSGSHPRKGKSLYPEERKKKRWWVWTGQRASQKGGGGAPTARSYQRKEDRDLRGPESGW